MGAATGFSWRVDPSLHTPSPRAAVPRTAVLLLAFCFLAAPGCEDAVGPDEGEPLDALLFLSTRGSAAGAIDLFRVYDDGTGVENMTGAPDPDYQLPRLSPDGSRLVMLGPGTHVVTVKVEAGVHPVGGRDLRPVRHERGRLGRPEPDRRLYLRGVAHPFP